MFYYIYRMRTMQFCYNYWFLSSERATKTLHCNIPYQFFLREAGWVFRLSVLLLSKQIVSVMINIFAHIKRSL